eukprot:gene1122-2182_t
MMKWFLFFHIYSFGKAVKEYDYHISTCINSLRSESYRIGKLAIANSATVDVSECAKAEDNNGYSVDTGNYDLCMRQENMWHCLAGSIKTTGEVDDAFGGVCVPKECGPDQLIHIDIRNYLEDSLSEAIRDGDRVLKSAHGQLIFGYFLKLNHTVHMAASLQSSFTCGDHSASMTLDRYLFFMVIAALVLTVLFCTIYHMSVSGWNLESLSRSGSGTSLSSSATLLLPPLRIHPTSRSNFNRIIESFSIIKNISFIFESPPPPSTTTSTESNSNTTTNQDRFAILDGLKTISILWIMLSHTLAVSSSIGILNPAAVLPPEGFLTHISAQLFFSARFAVDSFFFISGFLVTYVLLKRLDPISSSRISPHTSSASVLLETHRQSSAVRVGVPLLSWLPAFYLHRLVRLLPPYMFCLVLWWKIGVLMGRGPFWFRWLYFTRRCDLYWWTNLLFINNLVPYTVPEVDQCFYVSWYLANDMQFYCISPLFVVIYLNNNKRGILFTSFVCILSILLTAVIAYQNDLSSHTFDGLWVTKYSMLMYTKPQYRICTYLIGMISGMLWHMKGKYHPKLKLPPMMARTCLIGASVMIVWLMFGASSAYQLKPCKYNELSTAKCGSNWSLLSRVAYTALSRPLWAICLSIYTLLSGNDQGGPVQSFLSHPIWGPPAKLSFSVFLLHILIINIWFMSRTQKYRYSHFDFTMNYCAVVFMSFVCGLFVTLFVESPTSKLWRALQDTFSQQPDSPQRRVSKAHNALRGLLGEQPTTRRSPLDLFPTVSDSFFEQEMVLSSSNNNSNNSTPRMYSPLHPMSDVSPVNENTKLLTPNKLKHVN